MSLRASMPALWIARRILDKLHSFRPVKHETPPPRRRGSTGLKLPPCEIRSDGDFGGCGALDGYGRGDWRRERNPDLTLVDPIMTGISPIQAVENLREALGERLLGHFAAAKPGGRGDGKGRRQSGAWAGGRRSMGICSSHVAEALALPGIDSRDGGGGTRDCGCIRFLKRRRRRSMHCG